MEIQSLGVKFKSIIRIIILYLKYLIHTAVFLDYSINLHALSFSKNLLIQLSDLNGLLT